MPKYAVAYIYEERSKYDLVKVDEESTKFYYQGTLVQELARSDELIFYPKHLGIRIQEASNGAEALRIVRDDYPYHINMMQAILVT